MSQTQVTCPECGTALKLPAPATPGRAIRCPKCKKVFPIAGAPAWPGRSASDGKKPPPPPVAIVKQASSLPPAAAPPPARLHRDEDEAGVPPGRDLRVSGLRKKTDQHKIQLIAG